MTDRRPLVLLLGPIHEGGYRENLARLRAVHAALGASDRHARYARLLGTTPCESVENANPDARQLLSYLARWLAGDDSRLGRVRPTAVLLCGRGDSLERQAALVVQHGLPCWTLAEVEADHLAAAGEARLLAGQRQAAAGSVAPQIEPCGAASAAEMAGEGSAPERPLFSGPTGVVYTYFHGAEQALGARGIDYGRVRAGAHFSAYDRMGTQACKLAAAGSILRQSVLDRYWTPRMAELLVLLYRDGQSLRKAAVLLGLGGAADDDQEGVGSKSGEERARRLRNRALGCIGRALDARLARQRHGEEEQDDELRA